MFDNLESSMLKIIKPQSQKPEDLIALIEDYEANRTKYLDLDSVEDYTNDLCLVKLRSVEEVTGISKISSGYFSTVYEVDEHTVLKLTKDREDAAYDAFAKFCMNNPSKHLPKITWVGQVGNRTGYLIERLIPYEGEMATLVSSIMRLKLIEAGADSASRNGHSSAEGLDRLLQPTFLGPELDTAAHLLAREFENLNSGDFRWDLHGDNVMSRLDGTPVYTDPWSYR